MTHQTDSIKNPEHDSLTLMGVVNAKVGEDFLNPVLVSIDSTVYPIIMQKNYVNL